MSPTASRPEELDIAAARGASEEWDAEPAARVRTKPSGHRRGYRPPVRESTQGRGNSRKSQGRCAERRIPAPIHSAGKTFLPSAFHPEVSRDATGGRSRPVRGARETEIASGRGPHSRSFARETPAHAHASRLAPRRSSAGNVRGSRGLLRSARVVPHVAAATPRDSRGAGASPADRPAPHLYAITPLRPREPRLHPSPLLRRHRRRRATLEPPAVHRR